LLQALVLQGEVFILLLCSGYYRAKPPLPISIAVRGCKSLPVFFLQKKTEADLSSLQKAKQLLEASKASAQQLSQIGMRWFVMNDSKLTSVVEIKIHVFPFRLSCCIVVSGSNPG
jgi:hypothetical protein